MTSTLEILKNTHSLDKEAVFSLLELPDLPPDIRRVLEIRQQVGKTSVKKLQAMQVCSNADDRARGLHQYHGATTGRWAGRRLQTQNLPRPKLKQDMIESYFNCLAVPDHRVRGPLVDSIIGDVLSVTSDSIRGFIAAPEGRELLCADFSNIEGRVLAWLAGQEDKLDAFRAYDAGKGPDLYNVAAAGILGVPVADVTADQRQSIGKVSELAFGYQGGLGAWRQFSPDDGRTDDEIDGFKNAWRDRYPKIVDLWYALERAAMSAVKNPGKTFDVNGLIRYKMSGSFLFCRLPSSRVIVYPYPDIRQKEMPWGEERAAMFFLGQNTITRKWGRMDTYGGKLSENVTQAVARDVLADAMIRLSNQGFEIVMHVHDEIVAETEAVSAASQFPRFTACMAALPRWAEGLPIAVSGWHGRRYRK